MIGPVNGWEYFGATEAEGLTALRAALGSAWASDPSDEILGDVLERAAALLHDITGLFFVVKSGSVDVSGEGEIRQPLPLPVVSTDQGGDGITAITVDGEALEDLSDVLINEGAGWGGHDPRWNPFAEWTRGRSTFSTSPEQGALWPYGVQNIRFTGTFGFVEADGSTPKAIVRLLARIVSRSTSPSAVSAHDDAACDLGTDGLVSEATSGRSYAYSERALSYGVTLDRESDLILRRYSRRAGISVRVSRGRRRMSHRLR